MSLIHSSAKIHSSAIIEDGARIGEGCSVGPYSVIGAQVELGPRCRVGSHVVIEGHTRCGAENQFFQFASVGAIPQDLKYQGEPSELLLGDRNIIREYVTLQPGTRGGGMKTQIGDGNLFMACAHVGHDNVVGNGNIVANGASIAGHAFVGNRAVLGGLCGIHQFVRLGDGSMIAAGAMVAQDVPPYCMVQGDRAALVGLNSVGLRRSGLGASELTQLRSLYRKLFLGSGTFSERVASAQDMDISFDAARHLLEFCQAQSQRGICAPRKRGPAAGDDDVDG